MLSNKHRDGQSKTDSELRAERRQARLAERSERPTSEFATGAPTGTAPVLAGRFAPAPDETAAPITLPGRGTPEAADHHAASQVQADRTTRAPQQPAPESSTWEVETPGGPVVAGGPGPRSYLPEQSKALGGH